MNSEKTTDQPNRHPVSFVGANILKHYLRQQSSINSSPLMSTGDDADLKLTEQNLSVSAQRSGIVQSYMKSPERSVARITPQPKMLDDSERSSQTSPDELKCKEKDEQFEAFINKYGPKPKYQQSVQTQHGQPNKKSSSQLPQQTVQPNIQPSELMMPSGYPIRRKRGRPRKHPIPEDSQRYYPGIHYYKEKSAPQQKALNKPFSNVKPVQSQRRPGNSFSATDDRDMVALKAASTMHSSLNASLEQQEHTLLRFYLQQQLGGDTNNDAIVRLRQLLANDLQAIHEAGVKPGTLKQHLQLPPARQESSNIPEVVIDDDPGENEQTSQEDQVSLLLKFMTMQQQLMQSTDNSLTSLLGSTPDQVDLQPTDNPGGSQQRRAAAANYSPTTTNYAALSNLLNFVRAHKETMVERPSTSGSGLMTDQQSMDNREYIPLENMPLYYSLHKTVNKGCKDLSGRMPCAQDIPSGPADNESQMLLTQDALQTFEHTSRMQQPSTRTPRNQMANNELDAMILNQVHNKHDLEYNQPSTSHRHQENAKFPSHDIEKIRQPEPSSITLAKTVSPLSKSETVPNVEMVDKILTANEQHGSHRLLELFLKARLKEILQKGNSSFITSSVETPNPVLNQPNAMLPRNALLSSMLDNKQETQTTNVSPPPVTSPHSVIINPTHSTFPKSSKQDMTQQRPQSVIKKVTRYHVPADVLSSADNYSQSSPNYSKKDAISPKETPKEKTVKQLLEEIRQRKHYPDEEASSILQNKHQVNREENFSENERPNPSGSSSATNPPFAKFCIMKSPAEMLAQQEENVICNNTSTADDDTNDLPPSHQVDPDMIKRKIANFFRDNYKSKGSKESKDKTKSGFLDLLLLNVGGDLGTDEGSEKGSSHKQTPIESLAQIFLLGKNREASELKYTPKNTIFSETIEGLLEKPIASKAEVKRKYDEKPVDLEEMYASKRFRRGSFSKSDLEGDSISSAACFFERTREVQLVVDDLLDNVMESTSYLPVERGVAEPLVHSLSQQTAIQQNEGNTGSESAEINQTPDRICIKISFENGEYQSSMSPTSSTSSTHVQHKPCKPSEAVNETDIASVLKAMGIPMEKENAAHAGKMVKHPLRDVATSELYSSNKQVAEDMQVYSHEKTISSNDCHQASNINISPSFGDHSSESHLAAIQTSEKASECFLHEDTREHVSDEGMCHQGSDMKIECNMNQKDTFLPSEDKENAHNLSTTAAPMLNCNEYYECKLCEVFFKQYSMYVSHMRLHYSEDEPWRCGICGEQQGSCTAFHQHIQNKMFH